MSQRSKLISTLLVLGSPLQAQQPAPGLTDVRQVVELTTPHFIALSVPDLDASERWYRELFGLSVVMNLQADSNTRVRVLRSTNLTVELIADRRARPRGGTGQDIALVHGLIKTGLFVPDLAATITVLRAHGVTIEGQWLESNPRNLIVRDPDGNVVQFFERRP